MSDKLRVAAEATLAAYQHRFKSVAPRIGNFCGPIDDEMLALRAALAEREAAKAEPAPELTDDEILSIAYDIGAMPEQMTDASMYRLVRAVIARHEQKRGGK
jgi:hypothetical protein